RRARGRDRLAARPGPRPVRRRATRGVPARAGGRPGPRAPRRRGPPRLGPARRDRAGAQAPGRRRGAPRRQGPARVHAEVTGGRRPIEARLSAAGLPPLPRTAWLEIDLDALVANLAAIRDSVPPGTAVRPVVKADAYGHGAVPVARALQDAGVDGLCVAAFDEAVELRDAGLEAPIAVLYPVPPALVADAARLGVSVSAGDPVLLARMLDGLAAATGDRPDLAIELEIESGLGRDGFDAADLLAAASAIGSA